MFSPSYYYFVIGVFKYFCFLFVLEKILVDVRVHSNRGLQNKLTKFPTISLANALDGLLGEVNSPNRISCALSPQRTGK